jgi:hypothetical protein
MFICGKKKSKKPGYNNNTKIEIRDNNTLIPFNLEPVPACVLMTGEVGEIKVVSVVSVETLVTGPSIPLEMELVEPELSVVLWTEPPELALLTPEETSATLLVIRDEKAVLPVATVVNGQ